MILVALGSQKFQFDRLLREVDKLIEDGVITEEVFAQIGASTYIPAHYKYKRFLDQQEFYQQMSKADTIITHGGTGIITNAVKAGKKVIAVPRKKMYGEHVDDHQMQLISQFVEMNFIFGCMDVSELGKYVCLSRSEKKAAYHSNTTTYIKQIDSVLSGYSALRA